MYPSNKKKRLWKEEKVRLLTMTREERRKEYRDYISLDKIPSLMEELKSKASNKEENSEDLQIKNSLCEKVSLYKGDITQLEVDAIVNAANSSLLGGGGVDGCIHRASGPCLLAECRELGGCETGQAKITCGYDLPAKYVIHTVGPIARGHLNSSHKEDLASCYNSSLRLAKEHNIRTIAFPCISTGIYGFPNEPAAMVALTTVKDYLKKNRDTMDRVIFCVFLEVDFKIYKKKLVDFFPKDESEEEDDDDEDDDEDDEEDNNKNQDIEQMNEEQGCNQKPRSPPMKKYKGKKVGTPPETPEEDYTMKETENTQEMKDLSQDTDEGKDLSSPEEETAPAEDKITEDEAKTSNKQKGEASDNVKKMDKERLNEPDDIENRDESENSQSDVVMESQDFEEDDNWSVTTPTHSAELKANTEAMPSESQGKCQEPGSSDLSKEGDEA